MRFHVKSHIDADPRTVWSLLTDVAGYTSWNTTVVKVDMRSNGGGSLAEAVNLSGLFIGAGPVVQQRDARGGVTVAKSSNASVAWNGPLAVLINRRSASASEIFAAVIQDYGRGLVIGERSFGKGTVQTMLNLDRIVKNPTPAFGELKMTIAQFFRVNGGTTQLRGVEPDIGFPSFADGENSGESSFDNALPWTTIQAADFSPQGNPRALLPTLRLRHAARIKSVQDFQFLIEDAAEISRLRKKNSVSLNEAKRRQERDEQEARIALREELRTPGGSGESKAGGKEGNTRQRARAQDDGLQADERDLDNELAAEKARKSVKDVFLDEAANILSDQVGLLERENRMAAATAAVSSVTPARSLGPASAPAAIR